MYGIISHTGNVLNVNTISIIEQIIGSLDIGRCSKNTVVNVSKISFTTAAILIVVGYELNLSAKYIKQALTASVFRLLIMALLCAGVIALLSLIMPISQYLLWGIILVFAMPPVYVLPIFVQDQNENKYISTTISVYTLVTILVIYGCCVYCSIK